MCNLHYIFIAHTIDRTSITLSLCQIYQSHYSDVIMGAMASQITSLTIVCSTVYSGADQRKHQSSASLAFVLGIHRGPVNSPYKWPVTRKMIPFDDVIMKYWPVSGKILSTKFGNHTLCGEFTGDRWIPPTQTASNAEYVSIWWRYHVLCGV